MKNRHLGSKTRYLPALLIILTLGAGTVLAGSTTTFLPNGAALTVSIDDPVTGTEFLVPVGAPSIDVAVSGSASVGLGAPDATFIYAMDVSGSTETGSGTGCSPIVNCEQKFLVAFNNAVIASGQADEVGMVVYATTAVSADMAPAAGDQIITAPNAGPGHVNTVVNSTFSHDGGNGGVAQFTNKLVGFQTNCTAALERALAVKNVSSNSTNVVVLVSDGKCDNSGGGGLAAFNAAVTALANADTVVHTVAAGAGSSCTDAEPGFAGGTLQAIATGTGGQCFEVPDPGNLPNIIPNLIGSTLQSLEIKVDGGGKTPIPNTDINPDLPRPGPASVDYTTMVMNLGPGDHTICVTANGLDVTGGSGSATRCETIHLLQLTATPALEVNNLNVDDEHTVTATVLGDPGQVGGRAVNFQVLGQNSSATGTCSPNPDCTTDASGQVSFTYSVPQASGSAGTDTIRVSTTIAGQETHVDLTKEWLLLTAEPLTATNELSFDDEHTVTAKIWGNPALVSGIGIDFKVTHPDGSTTVGSGTTDASGQAAFTYSVPVAPASLGTDSIEVSATLAGQLAAVNVTKEWVDTTPPKVFCNPSVNPSGKNEPQAPGKGGKGQNPDGFYAMTGHDIVWPDDALKFWVEDTGSGTLFGPYAFGTRIKYTQAPGAKPAAKKIGSGNGQADAVDWHITGKGDAVIYAVDGSGNRSEPAACLVPPPPK